MTPAAAVGVVARGQSLAAVVPAAVVPAAVVPAAVDSLRPADTLQAVRSLGYILLAAGIRLVGCNLGPVLGFGL